jgi:hypothetical protein
MWLSEGKYWDKPLIILLDHKDLSFTDSDPTFLMSPAVLLSRNGGKT